MRRGVRQANCICVMRGGKPPSLPPLLPPPPPQDVEGFDNNNTNNNNDDDGTGRKLTYGRVVSHLDLALEQSGKLVFGEEKEKRGRMEWMDDGLSGFPTPKELKGWRGKEKCQ